MNHTFKVYVGDYDDSLISIERVSRAHSVCAPPSTMNPVDFYDHANQQKDDVYSNNMDYVRWYPPEQVMVVSKQDGEINIKCLVEHPKYEKLKDDLDAGELVSLFGFKWVNN